MSFCKDFELRAICSKFARSKNGNISETITHGLAPKEFKRWLKSTVKWLKKEHGVKLEAQVYKAKNTTLKSTWRVFDKHLNQNAVILIGFTGKQNQYSVISGITPKTLILFDSSKMQVIRKSQCSGKYNEERYCIEPKEVFYLTRKA